MEKEKTMDRGDWIMLLANFLVRQHPHQLHSIVSSPDSTLHFPLFVDFAELMQHTPLFARLLFSHPDTYLKVFDDAALYAHKIALSEMPNGQKGIEKQFIHVRINISGSPLEHPDTFPSIGRVRVRHRGILLTLKGIVIRSGAIKMHEGERNYICQKCKHIFPVYPEVEARNSISLPSICPNQNKPCGGTKFQYVENTIVCHDYQEIKVQESTQVLGVGAIPRSILVILKDDLVDVVKAGDDVIVTGLLTAKWSPELKDVRCDLDPVLIANNEDQ